MINNSKKKILKNLTLILSTNNDREEFILRFLHYYNSNFSSSNLNIIISDSGTKKKHILLKKKISKKKFNLKIKIINFKSKNDPSKLNRDGWGIPRFEYRERYKQVLKFVKSAYIVLAADDDFYLPDYFYRALKILKKDNSYSCIYGHQITFSLKNFTAFGKITKFKINKELNPPNPWQEDSFYIDRLYNLGKNPWSWFNWYAIQKTDVLKSAIVYSKKYNLDGYLFEKFLTFCHSVMYKSKKIDFVYCARQENPIYNDFIGREPFSYFRNIKSLNDFKDCCVYFLMKKHKIKKNKASKIINEIIQKDYNSYIMNDAKEIPRLIKNRYLKGLLKFNLIKKVRPKINQDSRLISFKNKNLSKEKFILRKFIEV